MELLSCPIRNYAWGSRSVIAQLQGRPVPSDGPEAELWMGAHPGAPSMVRRDGDEVSLAELIDANPREWLGPDVVARFGPRLPYLLKLLAAQTPLSLQAHPDADQARAGYAAEVAAGGDGPRRYADPHHKPELLVAVTPFEALCGFQDPLVSAEVFEAFGVPALDPVIAALRTGVSGLPVAVQTLLTWPEAERAGLIGAVTAAEPAARFSGAVTLVRRLAKEYPGDPGALVALLLNHLVLRPGEAIWMPAGNLHAYLHGAGVEIMAASDNVLRGGLTPKRVDVPELLRVLRFEVLDDPVVRAVPVTPGVRTWPVPVDDFVLHQVRLDGEVERARVAAVGPRLVFCLSGDISVDDGRGAVCVPAGCAAVGVAVGGELTISGQGEVYVASVGSC
ncbi:mannose-6-phosphate isomerase, type 1 [Micromonospora pattaloongensis]|uniref:mannose-6-phosphate isomerase n=1 Tax=Micromonospora pattaloongensis TaxID=405436 RepID=A0A1H3M4T7_9ACTN|nr:mannose-6-phosphate isomerase, class I [Micromonospora pattaloongensis]SDY71304.1 mannose-6-phosphate isomerase, type 1 [Micromonospora pattaloongensis]